MPRNRSNQHIIQTDRGEDYADETRKTRRLVAWCGEEWDNPRYNVATTPEDRHVCRECSKAFFADKLAETPNGFRLGDGLKKEDMEALGRKWDYRWAYPILDAEGREWGWLALPGGWGEKWRVVIWSAGMTLEKAETFGDPAPAMGWELSDPKYAESRREHPLVFATKEHALYEFPALIVAHEIKDKATTVTDGIAWAERVRVNGAKREQREREEADELAAYLDGLRSIRDTFGDALSNLERAGLMAAIAKWEK